MPRLPTLLGCAARRGNGTNSPETECNFEKKRMTTAVARRNMAPEPNTIGDSRSGQMEKPQIPGPEVDIAEVLDDFFQLFTRSGQGDVSKYMYLAPGDRFGAITQNPDYYVSGDEIRTLEAKRMHIVDLIKEHCGPVNAAVAGVPATRHIVEWGPGPAEIVRRKTLPLIELLAADEARLAYEAVDIKKEYAQDAASLLDRTCASRATEGDFIDHARLHAGNPQASCMFYWGVTFGNFQSAERGRMIAAMKAYDMACFTVDYNLDLPSLYAAYDTPTGKHAIMGALEYFQDFSHGNGVSGFDIASWEAEVLHEDVHRNDHGIVDELRMVSYVKSRLDQTLVFPAPPGDNDGQRVVRIAAGERFQIIESRKYAVERMRELFDEVRSEVPKRIIASDVGEGSRVGLVIVAGDAGETARR